MYPKNQLSLHKGNSYHFRVMQDIRVLLGSDIDSKRPLFDVQGEVWEEVENDKIRLYHWKFDICTVFPPNSGV